MLFIDRVSESRITVTADVWQHLGVEPNEETKELHKGPAKLWKYDKHLKSKASEATQPDKEYQPLPIPKHLGGWGVVDGF